MRKLTFHLSVGIIICILRSSFQCVFSLRIKIVKKYIFLFLGTESIFFKGQKPHLLSRLQIFRIPTHVQYTLCLQTLPHTVLSCRTKSSSYDSRGLKPKSAKRIIIFVQLNISRRFVIGFIFLFLDTYDMCYSTVGAPFN